MNVSVEGRDFTRRGFKLDTEGSGHRSEQYVSAPMLAFTGVGALLVEHVRVEKVWFVKVPEGEQKRLTQEWEERASE